MYYSPQKLINYFLLTSLRRFRSSSPASTMNVFTQTRNPITGSTEWDIQHEDYDYHQEIARSAFADMLHDTERNQKYQQALQLAIEKMHAAGKKANVLDIGTGTGLLSIMAARSGADSIVACEAFKPMAECCQQILKHNGVANKITLIPKRSTELTVGVDGDMKEKANILVTEVFDTELIGEGALPTFTHAHKHLLEADCIVVPDSAVVYAQVVECPTMQKWNKLNDLADEELQVILRTPEKMRACAGSASVHDIQLSQLPRTSFTELSEPIPVLRYDWSGRTALDKDRLTRDTFRATGTGLAQAVFMWWELNMDTEGKILLSCAPWWSHPEADTSAHHPEDTIPWRDHWMQAVYYLPQPATLTKGSEGTLISCHDEYSLWFYVENQNLKYKSYERPICECGVHIAFSRTHVSYLNDGKRSKKFLAKLREELDTNSVVLDFNGSSLMGLSAAKLGAKLVYIVESMNVIVNILKDYVKENGIENVRWVSEVDSEVLGQVTHVVCDPNFSSAILPWENLKMAYLLQKYKRHLKSLLCITPEVFELWAMPVEFQHLHKIRLPLDRCEGVDLTIFDELVERSRTISDSDVEAQPLWEYTCRCRGQPQRLLQVDLSNLQPTYSRNGSYTVVDAPGRTGSRAVNGFAVWASWSVGGKPVSCGPVTWPEVDQRVTWDPHTRQGVKILQRSCAVTTSDSWVYQLTCDLNNGQFDINIDLDIPE